MTATFSLKIGMPVMFQGRNCVIIAMVDLDLFHVKDSATGATYQAQAQDLSPIMQTDFNHHVDSVSEQKWLVAQKHYDVIAPLLATTALTKSEVTERAKQYGVHVSTVYRWLKQYQQTGVVTGLTRQTRSDKGKIGLSDNVEKIIQEVIEVDYLSTQRKSIRKIITEIARRCHEQHYPIPHANTIRARIKKISPQIQAAKRLSRQIADVQFSPLQGNFPNADYPLAVVQIDHTKLDIILVDDISRQPIGRPWITLAIDVFSRMVTGFYISFDPPSALSTGLCLAHSILPKEQWLMKHDVQGHWAVWGLPRKIHVDNAKEFRGKMLEKACKQYGIEIEWRPVGKPHFGGHIERLLGTILDEIHGLAGTTFSNTQQRKQYNSEKKAVLTLSEFETWLTVFITDVYHQRIHSALAMSPLAKWKEGILGNDQKAGTGLPDKVVDEATLRLNFMPFEMRTIQQYGVVMNKITYWHDVLRNWVATTEPNNPKKARKFMFRTDPRDLSVIWFYDPNLLMYFPIPYRDSSHPVVSIWEWREIQRQLKLEQKQNIDENMIFSAYTRMRDMEQQAKRKTKAVRRAEQRRQLDSSTRKPLPMPATHFQAARLLEKQENDFDDIQPFDDLDDLL
ncbi:DDE-type integrase/transposase/recombinase [Conchiformibius steedae DSM 2580]|uniref:DDE-type integrase/transposase/recombinase n=1 Tax=Conchiformibius steedae DSM 2580 TaxID=1121352 RepID=A0AAE9KZB7_9NEIS|nr:Mu transposase C-terminal domain-containing protein [Conchiformibius steedae]QMT34090.1 DDE-type integrase/transposase/recombinase [Conchiformibius steedae]URD66864.1 DDE-type integrase/transposase/recombinase [Conchiformibius steedae DSM 2580]